MNSGWNLCPYMYMLLSELEFKGKLDLKKCALDGSFVRAKLPVPLPLWKVSR